ncbi:MAG: SEL1-like repeat protein [Kiritimatiellae bacterium]|nr:SEL1-like repeat protein [Kiritimatiellia bacterium]
MNLFITELFKNPFVYFSTVIAFMGSICFHEFCHATVAHHLGDDTARNQGFQTLNPFKVMGWKSLLCLLLFGFSWGAVPVLPEDKSRFRRSAISLAGPLSNLLLLCLSSFVLHVLRGMGVWGTGNFSYLGTFVILLLYSNAVLFLLNILPIPPLDGWGTIEPFLPATLVPSPENKGRIFMVFIYFICFQSASSGLFDKGVEALFERFLPKPNAVESMVAQGNEFYEAGDFGEAYKAFAQAAEEGSPEGRLLQGIMLSNGEGVEQDLNKAYKLLDDEEVLKAFPVATHHLASLLLLGEGCDKDAKRAFSLLSDPKVLEVSPAAQFLLGICYYSGEGCEQDFKKAAERIKAAADAGNVDAMEFLGYQNGKYVDCGMPLDELLRQMWLDSQQSDNPASDAEFVK